MLIFFVSYYSYLCEVYFFFQIGPQGKKAIMSLLLIDN